MSHNSSRSSKDYPSRYSSNHSKSNSKLLSWHKEDLVEKINSLNGKLDDQAASLEKARDREDELLKNLKLKDKEVVALKKECDEAHRAAKEERNKAKTSPIDPHFFEKYEDMKEQLKRQRQECDVLYEKVHTLSKQRVQDETRPTVILERLEKLEKDNRRLRNVEEDLLLCQRAVRVYKKRSREDKWELNQRAQRVCNLEKRLYAVKVEKHQLKKRMVAHGLSTDVSMEVSSRDRNAATDNGKNEVAMEQDGQDAGELGQGDTAAKPEKSAAPRENAPKSPSKSPSPELQSTLQQREESPSISDDKSNASRFYASRRAASRENSLSGSEEPNEPAEVPPKKIKIKIAA